MPGLWNAFPPSFPFPFAVVALRQMGAVATESPDFASKGETLFVN
jgi:hypothetical protein